MVYSVTIQSGARAPADPGPRRDAPTLVFEGFPLVGEASPEDVSRALKVARRVVAYPDTDTDSATDSATEPEAAPPRVEDALEGFVKVEELVPQAEWRIEDPTPTDEDPEKDKETTDDARASPPPPPSADPPTPIDLVEEVLKAEAETISGRRGKEAPVTVTSATIPRIPRKPARRTKTHGNRGAAACGATRDLERSVVVAPPATRGSRRRASVSVNDLASDPAKAREPKPKPPRVSAAPKPADEEKKKKRRASLPASTPATPARGGAKQNARRRKSEPSAAPEPEKAPASYAVSEPDPDAPPARSGGPPGGPLATAPGVSGGVPPPPPPPPAAPAPAARARDALRHAKALLDEACISPAEYEAVKRECLRRILWG